MASAREEDLGEDPELPNLEPIDEREDTAHETAESKSRNGANSSVQQYLKALRLFAGR